MIFVTQKKSVYVDSVAGSDLNDGLTADTPKATCAAGMTVLASSGRKTIRLKCGSFFREQITLPAGKRLKNYGSGARPILDPRENTTGVWTLYGAAYTYTQTVNHALSSPSVHRVWEDGVRLKRVANAATVETTPGSFYAATPSGTTGVLYIHPTGDGNPNSNGKTYSYSYRMYGVDMRDGSLVDGITTGWNGGNDGSIRALARNCVIRNCDALDGSKHNLLIADGVCENVNFDDAEPLTDIGSQNMIVTYNAFLSGGLPSVIFRKCSVRMATYVAGVVYGWYAHGNLRVAKATFEDCTFSGCFTAVAGTATDTVIMSRCVGIGCANFAKGEDASTVMVLYRCRSLPSATLTANNFVAGNLTAAHIRHCEALSNNAVVLRTTRASGSTLTCYFSQFTPSSGAVAGKLWVRPTLDTWTVRNCIIYTQGGSWHNDGSVAFNSLVSNNNLCWPVGLTANSNGYATWSAGNWKTFNTWKSDLGLDASSVFADPLRTSIATVSANSVFNPSGPVFNSGFPVGVQPTDDAETLALLASVGYTP